MTDKKIEVGKALSFGWETFKKNWVLLLVLAAINIAVGSFQNRISNHSSNELPGAILAIVLAVLSIIISIGIIKVNLRLYDGEKPRIADIFRYTKYFWRYLGASILLGLLVAAGFILLIVPGIYWGLKYSQVLNLIVDKEMGISEAWRKSGEMTYGVKGQLLLFGLACLGVMILGGIALGVGILAAIPVVWLAQVYVYRHLL